uniref:Ig-like domain-containing protein n=1 Tax=Sander lucioperca TaxID=283035 RepID=A0A8C9XV69_SANLU
FPSKFSNIYVACFTVSGGLQVFVTTHVSVQRGHTTTLPCWLNPPQSAEGLEVRWFRPDHFESPIMFYREERFQDSSQQASYMGRVSFGLKDAASGGLTAGDLSLRLQNATIEDAGDYTCYVSSDLSDQGYDRASVSLTVTGESQDHMVNMSCESEGWYPEPSLRWSDQKQVLTPESLKYSKDSSGLLFVHSWLLVSSSTEVSCTVGISNKEPKEARVLPCVQLLNFLYSFFTFSFSFFFFFFFQKTPSVIFLMEKRLPVSQLSKEHLASLLDNTTGKFLWGKKILFATVIPQDVSPNTSNGFWFLSSSPDRSDSFQFSTEPKVLLPVRSRPQTVGVYLNYDGGELSFYNVVDKSLIGSLNTTFTGEVFPIFNPGKGDKAAMEILQRTEDRFVDLSPQEA